MKYYFIQGKVEKIDFPKDPLVVQKIKKAVNPLKFIS